MLPKIRLVPERCRKRVIYVDDDDEADDGGGDGTPMFVCCVQRRSFLAGTCLGLSAREYRHLKRARVPRNYLQILHCAHLDDGWIEQVLDLVEWFAGLGQIERAGVLAALAAAGYEISRDPQLQNFLADQGFLKAIRLNKSTRPGSLDHWGTVCSSWVWQVRAVTKRSFMRPMGDCSVSHTLWGNCMVLEKFEQA